MVENHRHDASEISRMLAGRIEALVRDLLPAGKRDGLEWRCGSVAGEVGKSLAVHLGGLKAGVWSDFSSGECGDALDLVAAVLYRGSKGHALSWASQWLGIGTEPVHQVQRAVTQERPKDGNSDIERTAFAMRVFLEARPELSGTPVDAYLRARAIDLAKLGRQPRSLRFHPKLWNAETRRDLPAMVAAIVGEDGKICAVHRTWLEYKEGIWRKANLENPKKSLGRLSGGSIRIWRGISGKSMSLAPENESVIIGEGIETCLSIAIFRPDRRIISAVSLSNLAAIKLPPSIASVTIAADNDANNDQAAKALQIAIERFVAEGRKILVARSPIGNDFNDALQAEQNH